MTGRCLCIPASHMNCVHRHMYIYIYMLDIYADMPGIRVHVQLSKSFTTLQKPINSIPNGEEYCFRDGTDDIYSLVNETVCH